MLVYVDDIIHFAHDLKDYMDDLNHKYILKEKRVGKPDILLGVIVDKFHMDNGK